MGLNLELFMCEHGGGRRAILNPSLPRPCSSVHYEEPLVNTQPPCPRSIQSFNHHHQRAITCGHLSDLFKLVEHGTLFRMGRGRVPHRREKAGVGLFGQRILGPQGPAMWARKRMWSCSGHIYSSYGPLVSWEKEQWEKGQQRAFQTVRPRDGFSPNKF